MSLVGSFTITNQNTFPVEVVLPNNTTRTIASQGGESFSSFGTYTIRQNGSTGVFFIVNYPATRLLSTNTATGHLTGDFLVSALLH